MDNLLQFLIEHGYLFIFLWVLADQAGLPLPVVPLLLTAGALCGAGQFDLAASIAVAASASFLSSTLWYEAGRRRGEIVLDLLCRTSIEPETCVRKSERLFSRMGKQFLLIAKFVPGLNMVAAPIAGLVKMPRALFLFLNALGALLWASTFTGLGYLFSHQLERLIAGAFHTGVWLVLLLGVALLLFLGFKYRRRHQLHARIAPPPPAEACVQPAGTVSTHPPDSHAQEPAKRPA